jgi:transcriptional regulator with XRE-family HTH domain
VVKLKADAVCSAVVHLLRDKRAASGLSMNIVAKRAGLSHSMISRVEHELRRPTL